MTETERIVRRVEAYAPMPDEEIYADFIRGFLRGKKRAQMLVGQRYYENRGDILRREKMVLGADGKWVRETLYNQVRGRGVRRDAEQAL